ncbi:hypothetical protein Q9Z14_000099 [Staphylococcus pseudintermedius]|nr:hypothetical protein [Staphylococcus pseudintermedius]EHT3656967.1 hypothetical protein [Staphylococcus pseudintermedius]EHT3658119.1 hypothetical protein [Staphylococcus pseudintermedius]EHV5260239.1 hypothetical protein [Staphylococcus pseudintermedius]EHV5319840.1 hypothetical protein [Staphylococcus pseudintermedius]EIE3615075.1 hypothetical protein [Staphylococcus pseudintermedius]
MISRLNKDDIKDDIKEIDAYEPSYGKCWMNAWKTLTLDIEIHVSNSG